MTHPAPDLAALVRDYFAAHDALLIPDGQHDWRAAWERWHEARRVLREAAGGVAATERGESKEG